MKVSSLFPLKVTDADADLSSQYVGETKTRLEMTLTLDRVIPLEVGYAVALYCWHDREGNQFVWFASRDSFDYQIKQEYRIRATIKAHRNYKGVKQTVINRLKLVEHCYRPFISSAVELSGHETTVNEAWENL